MSISAYFRQVSSGREGRNLTCCNEESIEVLGLQSGVGGDQRRMVEMSAGNCRGHISVKETASSAQN